MYCSIQNIVKLGAMLPLLLGATIFNPAKASALDVTKIPLLGSGLQRGLSIEPSLKLFDRGVSGNNIQVCALFCLPLPNATIPTPVAPQLNRSVPGSGLPQQVMQTLNQTLQPNSAIQQAQPLPGTPQPPQTSPQSLPQSPQISSQPTTLQQVGQVLLPQVIQAIEH